MRTIFKRSLAGLGVALTSAAFIATVAAPANAAVLACDQIGSTTVCQIEPDTLPSTGTSTSAKLTPSTAVLGSTVKLSGTVKNLTGDINGDGTVNAKDVPNGTLAGSAEVIWRRATGPGPDGQWLDDPDTSANETSDNTYAPSALLRTIAVNANGSYATSLKALHSGLVQVRYLAHDGAFRVNGRLASRSAWQRLTVVSASTTTVNVTNNNPSTDFTTRRFVMDPSRPLTVKSTALCSGAEHNYRVSLISVKSGPDTVVNKAGLDVNDTDFSRVTTFGANDVDSLTGQIRIQTQRNCSVTVSATQNRTIY